MSRASAGLSLSKIRLCPWFLQRYFWWHLHPPNCSSFWRLRVQASPWCFSRQQLLDLISVRHAALLCKMRSERSWAMLWEEIQNHDARWPLKMGTLRSQSSEFLMSSKIGQHFRRVCKLFLGELRNFFPMDSWKTSVSHIVLFFSRECEPHTRLVVLQGDTWWSYQHPLVDCQCLCLENTYLHYQSQHLFSGTMPCGLPK